MSSSTISTDEPKDAVRVAVRIRPLLSKDLAEGATESVRRVAGEPQVVLGLDRAFTYDHVFEPAASQAAVYTESARPLIDGVLGGFNATVLAYGQTGSGKTHTMGTAAMADLDAESDAAGLIPRMVGELFGRVGGTDGLEVVAHASFIEIYKEEVKDLLNISEDGALAPLPIREDAASGEISLTGLQKRKVGSLAEVMDVLAAGATNRATGATAMNATSSRSHGIFTLALELKKNGATYTPKLHFVDLAGSERAKRTGAEGERLKEGIQINRGLLALGNVINALCEKLSHVPYRDSKLTRLLQDSLGGNSKTLMIANVSPSDADLEETLNTLKYANRARQIKNKPIVAQDPTEAKISQLQATIDALTARLAHYEAGGAPLAPPPSHRPPPPARPRRRGGRGAPPPMRAARTPARGDGGEARRRAPRRRRRWRCRRRPVGRRGADGDGRRRGRLAAVVSGERGGGAAA